MASESPGSNCSTTTCSRARRAGRRWRSPPAVARSPAREQTLVAATAGRRHHHHHRPLGAVLRRAGAAATRQRDRGQGRPARGDVGRRRHPGHGVGRPQLERCCGRDVRQLLGRRRLRAGLGGQDHHRGGSARGRRRHARPLLHGAVAVRLHERHEQRHPQRLAPARRRAALRARHHRRVLERGHDPDGQGAHLRPRGPLPALVRARSGVRAPLPGRVPGHPEAVAGMGGHRTVHDLLRTGRVVDAGAAHRGGERHRQRRRVRGAATGVGLRRRRRRDHRRVRAGSRTVW